MIKIRNGLKKFGEQVIFENLNLTINKYGIHAISGKSGSGKTTLLNLMAEFDKLSSGSITIQGDVSYIFQNYELIDELTVKENIFLYSKLKNKNNPEYEHIIVELLDLEELFSHYPNELSGGQKQRVGIARALLQQPSIVLCDEPTESLDIENKIKVMKLLKIMSKSCIVVLVSHDKKIVENYSDEYYEINNKTIISQKKRSANDVSLTSFDIRSSNISLNKSFLINVINKIIFKKTILVSCIVSLLSVVLACFLCLDNYMFESNKELKSVVKDVVYINSENLIVNDGFEQIIKMSSFTINDKIYHVNILPVTYNQLDNNLVAGEFPKKLEVIVNQVLLDTLGKDILNKDIVINYIIDKNTYSLTTEIVGIVNEDIEIPMLYFVENNYEEYLKTQYSPKGENLYEIFVDKNTFYQYKTSFKSIPSLITKYENLKAQVTSPMYEQYIQEQEDKMLFKFMFKYLELMLLLFILLLIFVITKKDIKHLMKSIAIIASSNICIEYIKLSFALIKVFIYFSAELFILLLSYYALNCYGIQCAQIWVVGLITLFSKLTIMLFYLICIKKSNTSAIFKNMLDEQ